MQLKSVLPALFLALLAACGGGGGGGSSGPTDVQFTSFSGLGPNQRANMTGISQTASGTAIPQVGGFLVSSVALGGFDDASSRAQLTYDANRNLSAMSFTAPQSSASFSGPSCSSGAVCAAQTSTSIGVLGNPSFHAWNYQTYGVWAQQPSPTTFQTGAISVGAATPGSAVPTTGNATFTGFSSGFFTENMQPYFSSALVSAAVDWSARTVNFTTSNTTIGNLLSGGTLAAPDLDLSGTLQYSPGSNQFTGAVNATRNTMTGSATGRFYGPAAQEMGGVFGLQGSNTSSYVGAFGARRP